MSLKFRQRRNDEVVIRGDLSEVTLVCGYGASAYGARKFFCNDCGKPAYLSGSAIRPAEEGARILCDSCGRKLLTSLSASNDEHEIALPSATEIIAARGGNN